MRKSPALHVTWRTRMWQDLRKPEATRAWFRRQMSLLRFDSRIMGDAKAPTTPLCDGGRRNSLTLGGPLRRTRGRWFQVMAPERRKYLSNIRKHSAALVMRKEEKMETRKEEKRLHLASMYLYMLLCYPKLSQTNKAGSLNSLSRLLILHPLQSSVLFCYPLMLVFIFTGFISEVPWTFVYTFWHFYRIPKYQSVLGSVD